MTLERVKCVANLLANIAAVGAVCGKMTALQMLLAAVSAPGHLRAQAAHHRAVQAAHQVAVSQRVQPRVQAWTQQQRQRSNLTLKLWKLTVCGGTPQSRQNA
jgi:hypothetical protein